MPPSCRHARFALFVLVLVLPAMLTAGHGASDGRFDSGPSDLSLASQRITGHGGSILKALDSPAAPPTPTFVAIPRVATPSSAQTCPTSPGNGTTERVSVAADGTQGSGFSGQGMAITPDGNFVAFEAGSSNIAPNSDAGGGEKIFVRNQQTHAVENVSVAPDGEQADFHCYNPKLTPDARFIAFESLAGNLDPGNARGTMQIYVRDRVDRTMKRMSVASDGTPGNLGSFNPSISNDGRFVAFDTPASNLVANDTNRLLGTLDQFEGSDVFVHDRATGVTERVSVAADGTQANNYSFKPFLSPDGRFVAFQSYASNLVSGDTNNVADIFVKDRQTGAIARVSLGSAGAEANGNSYIPHMSADGLSIEFESVASNLTPTAVSGGLAHIYVRNLQTGNTEIASVDCNGVAGNQSSINGALSPDGRFVVFQSGSTNLAGDTGSAIQVFVHDRNSGATERASVSGGGTAGDNNSLSPVVSEGGRFIGFVSRAQNLVPNDTHTDFDNFVRDRDPSTPLPAPIPLPPPYPPPCGKWWNRILSADSGGQSDLRAVDKVSADDVWAVGAQISPAFKFQTLTEHWDGSTWTVVPSPNPAAYGNELQGVAVVSANDIWAVGVGYGNNGISQTLIMHWDGRTWTSVPSPNTSATTNNRLNSVAAVSANNVWAAGSVDDGNGRLTTLISHWNGAAWSIVPSPSVGSSSLAAIKAVSANDVWAVGSSIVDVAAVGFNVLYRTLILHWDGSTWTSVLSPNPGAQYNVLSGLGVVSTSNVWAVGESANAPIADSSSQTMVLRWNGSSWSAVASPSPGTSYNPLKGIAVVSGTDIWAVGTTRQSGGEDQTLTEHWDGTAWTAVPSPSQSLKRSSFLKGVTAVSATDVWAVGNFLNPDYKKRTLAERYKDPCLPNLPPIARMIANVTGGVAPLTVTFDASTSSDPDSGDRVVSFTINYGDGTAAETRSTSLSSHTYQQNGLFTAQLSVTDSRATRSLNTAEILINVGQPITIPGAPVVGNATSGDSQATITFAAPQSDGGSPITRYTVTCSAGSITATGAASPITVTGMTNGTTYSCSVAATNAAGTGPPSSSISVTAGAPSITTVSGGPQCSPQSDIPVTITGANFFNNSIVEANASARATSTLSPTQLRATIFAADLGTSRSVTLRVVNPSGVVSNSFRLTLPLDGDLNLDGNIDSQDLLILLNYLVHNVTPGTAPFTGARSAADLNRDTKVDAVDLVMAANYLAGNSTCLTAN